MNEALSSADALGVAHSIALHHLRESLEMKLFISVGSAPVHGQFMAGSGVN
jgi:hypothetical protein